MHASMGIQGWHQAIETSRTLAGAVPLAVDTTVDTALDALAVFARDDARAGSLVPITDAATDLVTGPQGARAARILDGIATWVDASRGGQLSTVLVGGRPGSSQAMQGLIMHRLADSAQQVTQWSAMSNFFDGPLAQRIDASEMAYLRDPDGLLMASQGARDFTDLLRGDCESILPRLQALDAMTGTHVEAAWANARALLDDPTGVLARERRWDQLYFVLHELEHAKAGTDPASMLALRALEEGTADLHARWPGAVEAFAAHLGIADEVQRPAHHVAGYGGLIRTAQDRPHPYDAWRDGMRGYVELAGIDPSDPAQLAASRDLLRGVELVEVPDRLARRILERRDMADPVLIGSVTGAIREYEPAIGSAAIRNVYGS